MSLDRSDGGRKAGHVGCQGICHQSEALDRGVVKAGICSWSLPWRPEPWPEGCRLGWSDSRPQLGRLFEGMDSDMDLVSKIKESLSCTICKNIFYIPVQSPCGHTFCIICLNTVFRVVIFFKD